MKKLLCIILSIFSLQVVAQLTVTTNTNATQLAQTIVGAGISVSNASLNCGGAQASGVFSYSGSDLGLGSGILLTTGSAVNVANPSSYFCNTSWGTSCADTNLINISGSGSGSINDACILSFDFVPNYNCISFYYIFGSEEYPNFVGSFNDVFGIFLTGPNPAGGMYNAQNIATLPSGTPVSINNVNSSTNSAYYIDNSTGSLSSEIAYGGVTIPINSVTQVYHTTYHLEIAIADNVDDDYDSGVFLSGQGFNSNSSCGVAPPPPPAGCALTIPSEPICYVSADSALNNVVYFNHDTTHTQGTIIYRQNSLSQWDSIGYVPSSHADYFVDLTSNANQQSYIYATAQIDSCGNLRTKSSSHKTILLQSSIGTSGQVNLLWNFYVGVTVPYYYIYRGATASSMSLLTQISSSLNAYTDLNPTPGNDYYKIAFPISGCTSNVSPDTLASSNYRNDGAISSIKQINIFSAFNIYPNPANTILNIELKTHNETTLQITDMLGNIVKQLSVNAKQSTIDVSNLQNGVYFIKIDGITRKFLKQ